MKVKSYRKMYTPLAIGSLRSGDKCSVLVDFFCTIDAHDSLLTTSNCGRGETLSCCPFYYRVTLLSSAANA
jgi:hypothetical protein